MHASKSLNFDRMRAVDGSDDARHDDDEDDGSIFLIPIIA